MPTQELHEHWYVIITKPRTEKKIAHLLSDLSIANFLPIQRSLRQWKDRKKWVDMPLFNSYIFVYTSEKNKNEIFQINGVSKFLCFCGKACTVTFEEIERIKRICEYNGSIQIETGSLQPGDIVIINYGAFNGLEGTVIKEHTKIKISIPIPSLNCFAKIEMDEENIIKIPSKAVV